MDFSNKHFIRINASNYVVEGFSNAFEQPISGGICINQEGGRHFTLNGITNPSLVNEQGCFLYKYDNNAVRLSTTEELQAQLAEQPPAPPTELDLVKNQLTEVEAAINFLLMT